MSLLNKLCVINPDKLFSGLRLRFTPVALMSSAVNVTSNDNYN